MIKSEPQVTPGCIYSKSETAKILCMSRVTLRKYTRLNRIVSTLHGLSGKECYTAESILAAWKNGLSGSVIPTAPIGTNCTNPKDLGKFYIPKVRR